MNHLASFPEYLMCIAFGWLIGGLAGWAAWRFVMRATNSRGKFE